MAASPLTQNAAPCFDVVVVRVQCQSEVRPEATLEALKRGRAAGMTTIFNPAPAKADLPDR